MNSKDELVEKSNGPSDDNSIVCDANKTDSEQSSQDFHSTQQNIQDKGLTGPTTSSVESVDTSMILLPFLPPVNVQSDNIFLKNPFDFIVDTMPNFVNLPSPIAPNVEPVDIERDLIVMDDVKPLQHLSIMDSAVTELLDLPLPTPIIPDLAIREHSDLPTATASTDQSVKKPVPGFFPMCDLGEAQIGINKASTSETSKLILDILKKYEEDHAVTGRGNETLDAIQLNLVMSFDSDEHFGKLAYDDSK